MGIAGVDGAAELASLALHALQHRGQESAGITVADGHRLLTHKKMGLVADVFDEATTRTLTGTYAIGHVRYSTSGSSNLLNAQPLQVASHRGAVSLAHNGNLVNAPELRREMELEGSIFATTSDSEVILHLLARSRAASLEEALVEVLPRVKGAYSMVVLSRDQLIAVRDPYGFRPLCLGRYRNRYVVASESCAFDIIGAEYQRDIEPGEMVVLGSGELTSRFLPVDAPEKRCIFEHVYFSRPDSRDLRAERGGGAPPQRRDPGPRGAGGRGPGLRRARLQQHRGPGLRPGHGHALRTGADPQPLRGAHLHLAGAEGAGHVRPH